MSVADSGILVIPRTGNHTLKGPVTAARQRRALLVYGIVWVIGLLPVLIGASAAWQAAGLGLWMPGAGFLADGGWITLLFPLTLALFVLSLVAWFWAGAVVAPLLVWGGAAVAAGLIAKDTNWPTAYLATAAVLAGVVFFFRRRAAGRQASDARKLAARVVFLANSLSEVRACAAAVPDAASRELSVDDLGALRYLYDRALQPIAEFNGFDIIDQFQPAALRYQLNHMGFALGIAQGSYLPNFHGYLRQAQNNLIQKYLLRKVWGYWVYESCWGHLNFSNFDPAVRDNIMLTGWFGMHVGQYMLNSGDRRYAEEGSLSFKLNSRTTYVHDFHTLIGSVVENYEHYQSQFCLFPCEPNWIYPICNHYGMSSLAVHDRLFGTDYVERFLATWLEKLDTEFTDGSGSIIGLRSKHLGVQVPFPVGEAGYCFFANCFSPERGQRLWAIARKELEPALATGPDGQTRLTLPGKGLDPGNYRTGHIAAFGTIMVAAREFGDHEIAEAAQRSLDQDCGLDLSNGARRYLKGSNLANATSILGRLIRTGDFRRSFAEGPAAYTLAGPVLAEASYPDVLVARAFSHGDDLELVLYPGAGPGPHALKVAQLVPGRTYRVEGGAADRLAADDAGTATLSALLNGRTALVIRPQDV